MAAERPRSYDGTLSRSLIMSKSFLSLLALVCLTTPLLADDPADELAKFAGTWQLVSAVRDGKETPEEVVAKIRVVIKDGKTSAVSSTDNFSSGRFNPSFSDELTSIMINPYFNIMGVELLGTYEIANGRNANEVDKRKMTQIAADLLYRFGPTKNFWVAGRYNTVKSEMPGAKVIEVGIDRITASAGWFVTPNVMMKLEYVTQEFKDFPTNDIRNGGKFDGLVISAALGF